jgi:hypothetical protein
VAEDRLRLDDKGEVWLTLRHRWADGTTHLRFDAVDVLGRLAVLTPRPRINLLLYYGVLAPRATGRAAVVARPGQGTGRSPRLATPPDAGRDEGWRSPGAYLWAQLMQRTFGVDVLARQRCFGRLRLMALIAHRTAVDRILRHLGLPTERPVPRPARPPPAGASALESYDEGCAVIDSC